jgi:23S rRNA (guanosine2251-2'-O)-methyltransferase
VRPPRREAPPEERRGEGKPRYIYGRHPVSELLRKNPREVLRLYLADAGRSTRLSDLVQIAQRHRIQVVSVNRRTLEDLVGGETPHQGIVAAVQPFEYADVEQMLEAARVADQAPLIVALDQIQDPHNLGAIVRSAYALGAHGVLTLKDRAAEVTPAVVKASAGATAHLPVAQVTNLRRALDELKEAGLWIVGAVAKAEQSIGEVDFLQPTVLVIGSEGSGLRRLTQEVCDIQAEIPMAGQLGSLNASVAASICLYEAMRQRRAST